MLTLLTVFTVKISNLKNPTADGRHFDNRTIAISEHRFDQYPRNLAGVCWPFNPVDCYNFEFLKFPYGGRQPFWKTKQRVSATVWPIDIMLHFLFCLIKPQSSFP